MYRYAYNNPVNYIDPTGEISVFAGGVIGGLIGGVVGFASSVISQKIAGEPINWKKAIGSGVNGMVTGAVEGALYTSPIGLATKAGLAVSFIAGAVGNAADQLINKGNVDLRQAVTGGVVNAAAGAVFGNNPLKNATDAFRRGALAGATAAGIQSIIGTGEPVTDRDSSYHECNSFFCCFSIGYRTEYEVYSQDRNMFARQYLTITTGNYGFMDFVEDVTGGAFVGGVTSVGFYGAGRAFGSAIDKMADAVGNHIKQVATNCVTMWKNFMSWMKNTKRIAMPGDDDFIGPLTTMDSHLIFGDGIGSKKKGVRGAHNMNSFNDTLESTGFSLDDLKIGDPIPHPTIPGIYEQYYRVPAYNNRHELIGYKIIPDPKTYYDPNIISNSQMVIWGKEAMANAIIVGDRIMEGTASNGLQFRIFLEDGVPYRYFPVLPHATK